ncbi:Eco57I restriction-modification methylase domain-containing protein [Tenacibaculum piscium]|uniref:Eco57I restriction-modification methylase domain-containing protein n=1 Tax=Tenacibaculum piscium TaxID=1458515 RepID=UPI00187B2D59|nr:N-6 DNA methylase [Tenacibaculum piscium]MBE7689311.1 N-6 DNA methylase [Tenacibaculum piscium]
MSNINSLIKNFSIENLNNFLRKEIPSFKTDNEELDYLFQDDIYQKYESIIKIGEAIIDNDELIIIASKTNEPLTERTGKKNQYEIAKTILKHEIKDASLFVFYDNQRNFRFSFVKANYLGTKRNFTDFKRYSYFVTPNQTNQTFIKQIGNCNFNSIDEIINAFSVEPLNKQFYQEISKSFYKLIGGKVKIGSKNVEFQTSLKLPATPIETNRKTYQEFAVRLIGRTIFCWFLKSKKSENSVPLIPESWLSSKIVNQTDEQEQNYYHSVLEKLFFLVLNKKQNDRKNYELPKEQELIPFLNGGLFEAQLDDFFPTNNKGIHQIAFDLKIPNQWFIELFEILEQYNFTIDENSIYDAEVSIDPEMLGTIFENLLAEIDPDTEKSARKATGSFYTPREIVDYMVEQSLVQYLKTKVLNQKEENLLEIFKEGGTNKFDKNTTEKILKALSEVKILDPACGSGAFPMGALHKIINALQKLDPNATWWKNKQIANVPNAIAQKMLKEKLDGENADYIRKLGIIQNSIYGVDIQPIASEISKLRSFLSLVIDETIIDEKENRGIQPLPNLEFKFVTANTLICLPEEENQQFGLFDNHEELEKLKVLRAEYLQSHGNKKIKIKERFLKVQKKAFKKDSNLFTDVNSRSFLITNWKPFGNESNSWFDPNWMFGVDKFDIVIGNPPYFVYEGKNKKEIETIKKIKLYQPAFNGKLNAFKIFLLKSNSLLKEKGVLCEIFQNSFLADNSSKGIREYFLKSSEIIRIDSFPERDNAKKRVFPGVKMSVCIMLSQNINRDEYEFSFNNWQERQMLNGYETIFSNSEIELMDSNSFQIPALMKTEKKIFGIFYTKKKIGDNMSCFQGELNMSSHREFFTTEKNQFMALKGAQIQKYELLTSSMSQGEIEYVKRDEYLKRYNTTKSKHHKNERIVMQGITGVNEKKRLKATLVPKNYFCAHSCNYIVSPDAKNIQFLKALLACLNSKFHNWIFKKTSTNSNVNSYEVENLTVPSMTETQKEVLINLVERTLKDKTLQKSTELLEQEIDIIIYKLYGLQLFQVKIIDPEFNLSEEEYKNYKL